MLFPRLALVDRLLTGSTLPVAPCRGLTTAMAFFPPETASFLVASFLLAFSFQFAVLLGGFPFFRLSDRNDAFAWCATDTTSILLLLLLLLLQDKEMKEMKGRGTWETLHAPRIYGRLPDNSFIHFGMGRANFVSKAFGVDFREAQTSKGPYRGERPCVYASNHRSWADFFLDVRITEGRGAALSRRAVTMAFPFFMLPAQAAGGVQAFSRGAGKGKAGNALARAVAGPVGGALIYPEGHRNLSEELLPLRTGLLRHAHAKGMLVQPVATANKERVLAEKRQRASFGCKVVSCFGDPVDPGSHPDFDDFLEHFRARFESAWADARSSVPGCESLDPLSAQPRPLSLPVSRALCFAVLAVGSTFVVAYPLLNASFGLSAPRVLLWLSLWSFCAALRA